MMAPNLYPIIGDLVKVAGKRGKWRVTGVVSDAGTFPNAVAALEHRGVAVPVAYRVRKAGPFWKHDWVLQTRITAILDDSAWVETFRLMWSMGRRQ